MSPIGVARPPAPSIREGHITSPGEWVVVSIAVFVQILLRSLFLLHHRADFDETQHLHIVWGWTHGLVQYRDMFDNHVPLFHLTMAPWIAAIGERADILDFARVMMVPFVVLALWATYRIGKALWSPRVGVWGAVLAGFVPSFLLTTTEFRTDVVWMAGWLVTLALLVSGEFTPRRAALAGLLLGMTLATSLKTLALVVALAVAAALTAGLLLGREIRQVPRALGRSIAFLVLGCALFPALVIVLFWRLHALDSLIACTVQYNLVPKLGLWGSAPLRPWVFPLALLGLGGLATLYIRRSRKPAPAGAILVFLLTGIYMALLNAFWPLITKQDYLPSTPLAALLAVAGVQWLFSAIENAKPRLRTARGALLVMGTVSMIDILALCSFQLPWRDANQAEERLLREVLRDTRPGEPIADTHGETVFRPRPSYYVLEDVTESRLADGLLRDRTVADVARTRTHFAVADNPRFPTGARQFLNMHYLTIGALRALGSDLGDRSATGEGTSRFDVSYPERFVVVADGAPGRGELDGVRYRGPILLQAGTHAYARSGRENHVQVIWAGAVERGLVTETPLREVD